MAKPKPFFESCSSENCEDVRAYVYKHYDKKAHRKPRRRRKGGLDVKVLEPARIPIMGERGEYTVGEHGLGIEFKRCYLFDYVDKTTHKQSEATCTEKRVVNIPRNTLRCYEEVSSFLQEMKRGQRGKPTIAPKILAAVACSRSSMEPTRVSEPIPPSVIAVITMEKLSKVRKSLEPLVKSGKINCGGKYLSVLEEKQCSMPKQYQRAFDDFVKGEKEERKWSGFRKLFGEYVAVEPKKLPEVEEDVLAKFVTAVPTGKKRTRRVKPFKPTRAFPYF